MLKVGEIDYANVYPLFHYLRTLPGLSFVKGVPSVLNKMIRESGLDIAPCSSIEFARHKDVYQVVPDISISCIGDVKSVMLYSDFPLEELDGKKIFLTGESSTSVVLFKILCQKLFHISTGFTNNPDDAGGSVLIGDKALFHYYSDKYRYNVDLGKAWFELTGLPFVFALWIMNVSDEIKHRKMKQFILNLSEIKANSKKNLAALIEHYSFKGLTPYQIIDYWETINYDLGPDHIKGLQLFYQYACEIGEIRTVPELDFFTD